MTFRPRGLFVLVACAGALAGGCATAAAVAVASPRSSKPSSTTKATASKPTTTTPTSSTPTTTTPTTTTTTTSTTPTPKPSDATSDTNALHDYLHYLKALVKGAPAGVARDQAFTAQVKKRCAGALDPVTTLASSQVSATALSDLGEEIGGDLALDYLTEADAPFLQLSEALDALVWADPAPAQTIHALLSAESAVLALDSSALCADARTLAAHPATVPPRTLSFLDPYLADSTALKSQLSDFLTVLSRYATTNDNDLISQINTLVAKFAAASAATEHTDATQILASLGLTS